jgi:chemotaxis protein CheD
MNNGFNEDVIDVATGEVRVSSSPVIIRALALGSCVAVVAYDKINKIGGLAHVMLPGKSLKKEQMEKTKYAENAIDTLLTNMQKLGSNRADIEISLVGGANMFGEDSIPKEVVYSILGYLETVGIEPKNKITGGKNYRTASLDIASGKIFYTEGDNVSGEL